MKFIDRNAVIPAPPRRGKPHQGVREMQRRRKQLARGKNPVTQLHAREMRLPGEYADMIAEMSGGKPVTILDIDAKSLVAALAKTEDLQK